MQVKKTIFRLMLSVAAVLPWSVSAQTSSINAFSPYSMYGVGELTTPGALPMRSMGGIGVGMRSTSVVNMLNPAAYSATLQRSFLFDFGIEGQGFYNVQRSGDATKRTSYNSINFHDIAFQLPLTKGLGFGFSLTPYSSVGYRLNLVSDDEEVLGNLGKVNYLYEGEGDVTEVKFGVGWEVVKNLSIGIAAQYYWGDIDRSFIMTPTNITGSGTVSGTSGNSNYSISRIMGQLGVQWTPVSTQKRMLTVGATYDLGGDLRPRVKNTVYVGNFLSSEAASEDTHLKLVLPNQFAAGVYYMTPKIALGFDYVYQNWGGRNSYEERTGTNLRVAYTDTHTVKLGVEYTPNRFDVRRFFNRVSYRAGVRYGNYNQTFAGKQIGQYAVTAGFGIPVKFLGLSGVDIGVEYGGRGSDKIAGESIGLVRQHYVKFALGLTLFGDDYWFVRPKFD